MTSLPGESWVNGPSVPSGLLFVEQRDVVARSVRGLVKFGSSLTLIQSLTTSAQKRLYSANRMVETEEALLGVRLSEFCLSWGIVEKI